MSNKDVWVSTRDVRIASTRGHVINMVAGEPKTLPSKMAEAALAQGCVRAADAESAVAALQKAAAKLKAQAQAEADEGDKLPTDAEAKAALVAALETINARENADDYTKHGTPKVDVVNELAGEPHAFKANEIYEAWVELTS